MENISIHTYLLHFNLVELFQLMICLILRCHITLHYTTLHYTTLSCTSLHSIISHHILQLSVAQLEITDQHNTSFHNTPSLHSHFYIHFHFLTRSPINLFRPLKHPPANREIKEVKVCNALPAHWKGDVRVTEAR